jgi:predicted RNase H-like nuclease (RuvC/YqgF family)
VQRLLDKSEADQEEIRQLNLECVQQTQIIKDMKSTFDQKAQEYEYSLAQLRRSEESAKSEVKHLSDYLQSKANEISQLHTLLGQQKDQIDHFKRDQERCGKSMEYLESKNQSLMKLLDTQISANERQRQISLDNPALLQTTHSSISSHHKHSHSQENSSAKQNSSL